MSGTLADYEVAAITETAIMDVYPYTADDDNTNATPNANTNANADANTPNP
jgi:hypothetical protein